MYDVIKFLAKLIYRRICATGLLVRKIHVETFFAHFFLLNQYYWQHKSIIYRRQINQIAKRTQQEQAEK